MSLLDFESSGPAPRGGKKNLKLVLGISALAGAITLGSTLAASINLNGGGNVEFGQGFVTTTACDDDGITVTPFSTFVNAQGGGDHKLSSIRLSGIDSSAGDCEGKTFRIRAYGDGPDPLDLFNWTERDNNGGLVDEQFYDFVDITRTATDFLWTSGGTDNDDVIDINESNIEQTAFTLDLVSLPVDGPAGITRTPLVFAEDVKRITVETFTATDTPAAYAVGDTGPGGGKVFFVKSTGPFSYTFVTNQSDIDDYRNNPGMYAYFCTTYGEYCEEPAPQYDSISLTSEEQAALDFNYLELFSVPTNDWYGTWGSDGIAAGGVGSKIGTGKINTQNIVATFTSDSSDTNAAKFVDALTVNGYEDWFLPSSDELNLILWLAIESNSGGPNIGSFPFPYWASTYNTSTTARLNGIQGANTAPGWQGRGYGFGRIIAVRSF